MSQTEVCRLENNGSLMITFNGAIQYNQSGYSYLDTLVVAGAIRSTSEAPASHYLFTIFVNDLFGLKVRGKITVFADDVVKET